MITSQPFVLDSRNQSTALNKSGRPASEAKSPIVFLTLFFIPFISVGLGLAGASIHSAFEWWQIQQSGENITAKVMNLRIDEDSDGDTFYATYRFSLNTDEGYRAYSKTKNVGKQLYYTLEKGGPIAIRYLKSDPNTSKVGTSESLPGEALALGGFALVWNAIIGTAVWAFFYNVWLDQQFAAKSQLLSGTLTQVSTLLDSDDDLQLKLTYQFHSPDGDILSGNISRISNDLKGKTMPVIGTPVVVAFLDKKRHRLL